jgi:hypothetical protein
VVFNSFLNFADLRILMQISQKHLDEILGNVYRQDCIYLKQAELDLLKAEGIFEINSTFYTTKPIGHLTDVEAKICLNQLAYVAFAEWIDMGEFDEMGLSFEIYPDYMQEHMLIFESSIKFKKQIDTTKPFKASMQVREHKQLGDTYFVFLDYSFEDGDVDGKLGISLTMNNSKTQ